MPPEVELFDDLDAVARDAAGALDRGATPSLFDRLAWFRLILAHCPLPGRPLVARAAGGGNARAWLFLMVDRGAARALASWYTLDFEAVVRSSSEAETVELLGAIAQALRQRRPRIDQITLAPVRDARLLEASFREAGWAVTLHPATTNWRVRTAGASFADYWSRRPGKLRETARRQTIKAGLEITIIKHFDEQAWTEYEQVYARSWKPAEGSPNFLHALAEAEGEAGTLRLGIARKDGEAVAAQLWLVENGVATIHKLAHVEAARALSPGTVLSAAMFRAVIEGDAPEWIDFGTGDDAYKADWMDERRTLYRLDAFNLGTARGLAAAAREHIGSLARRLRSV